eukprot:1750705-Rhodomonas_salina.2
MLRTHTPFSNRNTHSDLQAHDGTRMRASLAAHAHTLTYQKGVFRRELLFVGSLLCAMCGADTRSAAARHCDCVRSTACGRLDAHRGGPCQSAGGVCNHADCVFACVRVINLRGGCVTLVLTSIAVNHQGGGRQRSAGPDPATWAVHRRVLAHWRGRHLRVMGHPRHLRRTDARPLQVHRHIRLRCAS